MNIVQLLISKGADAWNMGLAAACEGQDDHIDLMNPKCLLERTKIERSEIARLMISKGATECDNCDESLADH